MDQEKKYSCNIDAKGTVRFFINGKHVSKAAIPGDVLETIVKNPTPVKVKKTGTTIKKPSKMPEKPLAHRNDHGLFIWLPSELIYELFLYHRYPDILELSKSLNMDWILQSIPFWLHRLKRVNPEATTDVFQRAKSIHEHYLKIYSEKHVTMGSEKYQRLTLCVHRAAKRGDILLINYFLGKGGNYRDVFSGAASGGHLEIMKDALLHGAKASDVSIKMAAYHGHWEVITFLLMIMGTSKQWLMESVMLNLGRGGHLDLIIKFEDILRISKRFRVYYYYISCMGAVEKSHVHVIESMIERDPTILERLNLIMERAMINGSIEVLEMFKDTYKITKKSHYLFSVFNEKRGYELLQWLLENTDVTAVDLVNENRIFNANHTNTKSLEFILSKLSNHENFGTIIKTTWGSAFKHGCLDGIKILIEFGADYKTFLDKYVHKGTMSGNQANIMKYLKTLP